jgi:hypothetical protein
LSTYPAPRRNSSAIAGLTASRTRRRCVECSNSPRARCERSRSVLPSKSGHRDTHPAAHPGRFTIAAPVKIPNAPQACQVCKHVFWSKRRRLRRASPANSYCWGLDLPRRLFNRRDRAPLGNTIATKMMRAQQTKRPKKRERGKFRLSNQRTIEVAIQPGTRTGRQIIVEGAIGWLMRRRVCVRRARRRIAF